MNRNNKSDTCLLKCSVTARTKSFCAIYVYIYIYLTCMTDTGWQWMHVDVRSVSLSMCRPCRRQETPTTKASSASVYRLLVEWNTEKRSAPSKRMLPTYKRHVPWCLYLATPVWHKQYYARHACVASKHCGHNRSTRHIHCGSNQAHVTSIAVAIKHTSHPLQ
jgi:hypothetical protein